MAEDAKGTPEAAANTENVRPETDKKKKEVKESEGVGPYLWSTDCRYNGGRYEEDEECTLKGKDLAYLKLHGLVYRKKKDTKKSKGK